MPKEPETAGLSMIFCPIVLPDFKALRRHHLSVDIDLIGNL